MGFFFFLYVTCLSKGLEILIGWPHHMETANESHCSDYFLLDVARLFMSSIWPSSISDCNLSPPSIGFWSDGQEAFIFVLFLLDCLEVACLLSTHVNIEWNNVGFFLLYSANELCESVFVCVCCFELWPEGKHRWDWGCFARFKYHPIVSGRRTFRSASNTAGGLALRVLISTLVYYYSPGSITSSVACSYGYCISVLGVARKGSLCSSSIWVVIS